VSVITGTWIGLAVGAVTAVTFLGKDRRALRRAAGAFEPGSATVRGAIAASVAGCRGGYRWQYRLVPRTNTGPSSAQLTTRVSPRFDWKAELVGGGPWLVDLGKLLAAQVGVLRDVEVGDPVLDRRFRFAASDPEELQRAFTGGGAREALLALAATQRFRAIIVRKGTCTVSWSPKDRSSDGSVEGLRARLDAVASVLTACGFAPGSFD